MSFGQSSVKAFSISYLKPILTLRVAGEEELGDDYIVVLMTSTGKEEAEKIVHSLLERKLIACANVIGPVQSHFHWSGKIESAEEYLVLMKSREKLFGELSEAVKTLHSYEVPEILALRVVAGSRAYLNWLDSCLA